MSHKTEGGEFGSAGGFILTSVIPMAPRETHTSKHSINSCLCINLRLMKVLGVSSIDPGTTGRDG